MGIRISFDHDLYRSMLIVAMALQGAIPGTVSWADQQKPPAVKQNVIRVSKETTRIVKPLDNEGYVDYVQAVNDLFAMGVTPQNNYEVIVRAVMSPEDISESIRKDYFSRIGIRMPDKDARFYQDFITFSLDGSKSQEERDQILDEQGVIMSTPWKAVDHPRAAKWVAEYGRGLDKLAEGSKRDKYYTPYLTGDEEENEPYPRMISLLLPSVQQQREIARGLSIRAMGRIAAGDLDGAWSDVQAMHRVSRHVGEGLTLIESLVAIAIDAIAFQAEVDILNSPKLTDDQAKRFLADLRLLRPLPPIAEKIDMGERYMGLDAVTALARHSEKHGLFKMLKMIDALSDANEGIPFSFFVAAKEDPPAQGVRPKGPIDWNVTLIMMNEWYDRMVDAAREPNFEKRKNLFAAINRDLKKLAAETTDAQKVLGLVVKGGPRKAMGEAIGRLLVALLLPAIDAARSAEDQATARRELIQLAFSLELYRRDKRSLPMALSGLVPAYASSIADDPLSGKSLRFQVTNDGFLLYSVGRNGVDDQGRSYDDANREEGKRPEWDDIVVRVRH